VRQDSTPADTVFLFHIHKAVAGQNGPVVVNFVPAPRRVGCVTVDDRRPLSDIKRSPKTYSTSTPRRISPTAILIVPAPRRN
jgi:hypothetical protein